MYEVTATRKRPQVFDSLVGQDFVVSTIKNAIEAGKIAHAYLFSGPRGVGKTSSARILAKMLNCVHGPTSTPCQICSNCIEIAQGNSLDVIEIDGASNTSVNDVRVIRDEVLFPPQSGRYKIYIIDEVHMLSNSAFNALLKTIEEPPEYVVFIFATTESQKVPPTIRSRCQQFHFQLLSLQTIKQSLSDVAKELGVSVDDDALFWIAKESTGSMRDAYTLFDQITAFSEGVVTLKKIQDKLGLAGPEKLAAIVSYAYHQQGDQAIEHIQQLLASGVSVEQAVKDFAEFFRTLLLARRGIDNESILQMQMDRIPQDLQSAFNEDQLEAALELFLQLYRDIRFSLNPRFELELAVSRLSSLVYLVSNSVLLKRLTELQNNLLAGKETATIASRPLTSVAAPSPTLINDSPKHTDVVVNSPKIPPVVHQEVPTITNPITEQKEPVKPVKRVTKDILPAITQQLAIERNQLGIIISQVVDVVEKEDQVVLVFSSRFSMQTAKLNEEKIRSLIEHETGYDGKIDFGIIEVKQTEGQTRKNMDEVIDLVKTTFRGEIV